MKTKGQWILFWVLVALFTGAALYVLTAPQREPGFTGPPGIRLTP